MSNLDNDTVARLTTDRFMATKIHQFDQLTAVSQGAINRQMRLMHTHAEKDSPILGFSTQTTADDSWTCVTNVKLDPPKVELLTDGDSKQSVLFTLSLKSGDFRYLGGQKTEPSKNTTKIKDWRLVFRVRLNLKILDQKNVPQFVQNMLSNMDDYSVHQLLVDFTTADISSYEKHLSHINLPTVSAKLSFTSHIEQYLADLTAEKGNFHSTIHYLPTLQKPENYRTPSLRATDMSFQNLAFVRSSTDQEGLRSDDKNMLLYLQMTQNRKFPRDLLPWPQANWVVPPIGTYPRYDGTVCLSRNIFLDGWLLEKLARFNEATTWRLQSITYDPKLSPLPFNIDAHLGYDASEIPEKGTPCPWVLDPGRSTSTKLHYTYTRVRTPGPTSDKYGGMLVASTGPGANSVMCQQNAGTENHLEIPIGGPNENEKCVIRISGKTEVWSWGPSPDAWCITTAEWNASLVFDCVDHGMLKIEMKFPPANVSSQLGLANIDKNSVSGKAHTWVVGHLNTRVDEGVQKLKGSMSQIKNEIENGLTGEKDAKWRFIFGGNDDFFIDKVAFNSEGDLLAQLVYMFKA